MSKVIKNGTIVTHDRTDNDRLDLTQAVARAGPPSSCSHSSSLRCWVQPVSRIGSSSAARRLR